jgi:hypothetical protein
MRENIRDMYIIADEKYLWHMYYGGKMLGLRGFLYT